MLQCRSISIAKVPEPGGNTIGSKVGELDSACAALRYISFEVGHRSYYRQQTSPLNSKACSFNKRVAELANGNGRTGAGDICRNGLAGIASYYRAGSSRPVIYILIIIAIFRIELSKVKCSLRSSGRSNGQHTACVAGIVG